MMTYREAGPFTRRVKTPGSSKAMWDRASGSPYRLEGGLVEPWNGLGGCTLMSYREVNLLRGRSLRMLDSAKRCLASGDYDIAAFMADQAVQLYLKSMILELSGEMPRTHSIRQLFNALRIVLGKPDDIDQFVSRSRSLIIRLEDAYINSRYVSREYEREEAEELACFAEEAITFVKSLRGEAQD
jgi:HEPN domain-containing protein